MDDRTVGLIVRALRRRRKWRQVDLARASKTSQALISRVERGHVAELTVQRLRTILLALDTRLGLAPSWRGAELERLLDEDHAATVAMVARRLEQHGWTVALEVTYSEYGEHASLQGSCASAITGPRSSSVESLRCPTRIGSGVSLGVNR